MAAGAREGPLAEDDLSGDCCPGATPSKGRQVGELPSDVRNGDLVGLPPSLSLVTWGIPTSLDEGAALYLITIEGVVVRFVREGAGLDLMCSP